MAMAASEVAQFRRLQEQVETLTKRLEQAVDAMAALHDEAKANRDQIAGLRMRLGKKEKGDARTGQQVQGTPGCEGAAERGQEAERRG